MNASSDPIDFRMPAFKSTEAWELLIDTTAAESFSEGVLAPNDTCKVGGYAFLLFMRRQAKPAATGGKHS
jgi:hypothetical protein